MARSFLKHIQVYSLVSPSVAAMLMLKFKTQIALETRDQFLDMIRSFIEPVRVEEGCVDYQVCDYDNGNRDVQIEIFQIWNSEESLKRHLHGNRFRKLLQAMDMLIESPDVQVYRISDFTHHDTIQDFLNLFRN